MDEISAQSQRANGAPVLLLAGLSVRALGQAARRAGFSALGFDAFGDSDARAACRESWVLEDAMRGFADVDLEAALAPHAPGCLGLVYGSGFDDCPQRLADASRATPILGTLPQALARAKDPGEFAQACARAGLAHPEIAFAPQRGDWLTKRRGGSGGAHIRDGAERLGPDEYAQRRVAGRAVSLLFVQARDGLTPIGWSEQWTAPAPGAPYRFGGAAGPTAGAAEILPALAALAQDLGLRGLASADLLDDGEALWLLEINPRPGATLDLFDDAADPLIARHVAAARDRPISAPPRPRAPRALEIVYAERDTIAPPLEWPDWAADRPAPGTPIPRGAPVCTVTAADRPGASARAAQIKQAFVEGAHG